MNQLMSYSIFFVFASYLITCDEPHEEVDKCHSKEKKTIDGVDSCIMPVRQHIFSSTKIVHIVAYLLLLLKQGHILQYPTLALSSLVR